jgi:hypothetical protein
MPSPRPELATKEENPREAVPVVRRRDRRARRPARPQVALNAYTHVIADEAEIHRAGLLERAGKRPITLRSCSHPCSHVDQKTVD